MDANTSETTSRTMNFVKSNPFVSNDRTAQIIKNSGIVIIGGLVTVDIASAIFSLSMRLFISPLINKHYEIIVANAIVVNATVYIL